MATPIEFDALILAGGQSRRMGRNKALLAYHGAPLIEYIVGQVGPLATTVRVSTNDAESFAFLGLPMVPDLAPDQGPLMGIASGLRAADKPWTLVVPTDMPELPLRLLPAMFDGTASGRCVIPRSRDGRLQPLFGLYHAALADEILAFLAASNRRVLDFIQICGAVAVPAGDDEFANLNDPEDYRNALKAPLA